MEAPWTGKENGGLLEHQGSGIFEHSAAAPQACYWQPARVAAAARPLRLDVRHTPLGSGTEWAAPPVSCPSRLQHSSPARDGSSNCFDPFAAPQDELRGCTPLCPQQANQPAAPPAVLRKPASDGSPGPAPPPAVALFAGRVQSCPPERLGRRSARPLVRLRVKRSLNGAVAAAGGPSMVRRSLDTLAAVGSPQQQLVGCSRKRFEAELVSSPMPRKSSRTLLNEQQAAEMMARLQLAPGASSSGDSSGCAALMTWAPPGSVPPPASGPLP